MVFSFKKIAVFLLFLAFWGSFQTNAWAQFDTETPTYSPTPKFAVTGTPQISTVWLGTEESDATNNAAKTPAPKTKALSLTDKSMEAVSPLPAPTPSTGTGAGSSGNNGGSYTSKKNGSGTKDLSSGSSGPANDGDIDTSSDGSSAKTKGRSKGSKTAMDQDNGGLTMLDLYHAGINNYRWKNYGTALENLKEALTIKDSSVPEFYYAEANAMIGVIYKFDLPDAAQARNYCETALMIDPTTRTAQKLIHEIDVDVTETEKVYWTGIKFYEQRHFREAIGRLEEVVETKDPTTPSFYYAEAAKTLGIIYQFYQKDPDLARKYYRVALRIEPSDRVARSNLTKLGN